MRIWLSGPRLFGGLVRPGIGFSATELRRAALMPREPHWLDRLLLRTMALGVLIVAGAFVFVVGAMLFGLLTGR